MPSTQPHATPPNVARSHRYLARDVLLAMVLLGMVACSGLVAAPHAVAAESAVPAQTAVQPGDVVLLDFSASWCGPCRAMAPVVQGIEQAGWPVRHIDVDQEHDLVRRFGVSGVPCYILLVKGHQVGRIDGATTQRELE
jgi:thioredoxin 1